jgi:hypothetical protein
VFAVTSGRSRALRLAGDQHVVGSDRQSAGCERGPDLTRLTSVLLLEGNDFEEKPVDELQVSLTPPAPECTETQLVNRDHRQSDLDGSFRPCAARDRAPGIVSNSMTALASIR